MRSRRYASHDKFRSFRLVKSLETHNPENNDLQLSFCKRSKIIEIVCSENLLFSLTQTGICAVFLLRTMQKICYLNLSPDEVIRSLFLNKKNMSVVTVSVYRDDNFSSLKCRSTKLSDIEHGYPDTGHALFESECLKWPGFVEFDSVNGKVLTHSVEDSAYKIWDLASYNLLFELSDESIEEVKISPGKMLLTYKMSEASGILPIKILSIDDGEETLSINYVPDPGNKVEFVELFKGKLLLKQEHTNLQIFDTSSDSVSTVFGTEFIAPNAFVFLFEKQRFLTFDDNKVTCWNFEGEKLNAFEDHELWHSEGSNDNIFITEKQDIIISHCCCRPRETQDMLASINVSEIKTGKLISKICSSGRRTSEAVKGASSERAVVREENMADHSGTEPEDAAKQDYALAGVTSLVYNESRNEIYTGNSYGNISIWTN